MFRSPALSLGSVVVLALLHWWPAVAAPTAASDRIDLSAATRLLLAAPEQARAVIAQRDDYLQRVNPRERSAKRGTPDAVSLEQYVAWIQSDVQAWDEASRAAVAAAARIVRPTLAELPLPLPPDVLLVRMRADHMARAAYTRGTAIFLPDAVLASPTPELAVVLAHELFHVASRHDRAFRATMYGLIGVRAVPEIELPADLKSRLVTNPDAPLVSYVHPVMLGARAGWVAPVLVLAEGADALFGQRPFFAFIQLRLLEVELDAAGRARVAGDAAPRLHAVNEVSGFFERIGRNTDYIIAPEEILATNYMLFFGSPQSVPTPQLLQRMRAALRPG